jgi:hypothetical protein
MHGVVVAMREVSVDSLYARMDHQHSNVAMQNKKITNTKYINFTVAQLRRFLQQLHRYQRRLQFVDIDHRETRVH